MKKSVDAAAHDRISKIVERSFILRKVCGGKPVPHHHIRIVLKNLVRHLSGILHRIGVVAIHHNVTLRLYFPEHSADHIAFALHVFISDHRAGVPCKLHRAVAGIIVININHRLGQRFSGIPNYFRNGLFLIITGN